MSQEEPTRANFAIPMNRGHHRLLLDENGEVRPAAEPQPEAAEQQRPRRRIRLPRWQQLTTAQRVIIVASSGAFIAGLLVGLVILGWWLWPVKWTDARYGDLAEAEQRIAVMAAADLHAYDERSQYARALASGWGADQLACRLAAQETDAARQMRLAALAYAINGYGCTPTEPGQ